MAGIVYLKLMGKVQNQIKGSSTDQNFGRKDAIECKSFTLNVIRPHDRPTGLATGRRLYEPIQFIKDIDQATPGISKALVTNEEILSAEFRFFDVVNGTEKLVYTILTTGGRIVSQRQLANALDAALLSRPPQEEVGLVFQSITGTWDDPNIVFTDTWAAQT
jgi:type VI secretion system secreted protein Hcp